MINKHSKSNLGQRALMNCSLPGKIRQSDSWSIRTVLLKKCDRREQDDSEERGMKFQFNNTLPIPSLAAHSCTQVVLFVPSYYPLLFPSQYTLHVYLGFFFFTITRLFNFFIYIHQKLQKTRYHVYFFHLCIPRTQVCACNAQQIANG